MPLIFFYDYLIMEKDKGSNSNWNMVSYSHPFVINKFSIWNEMVSFKPDYNYVWEEGEYSIKVMALDNEDHILANDTICFNPKNCTPAECLVSKCS